MFLFGFVLLGSCFALFLVSTLLKPDSVPAASVIQEFSILALVLGLAFTAFGAACEISLNFVFGTTLAGQRTNS